MNRSSTLNPISNTFKYNVDMYTVIPVQFHNWYKLNHQIHGHLARSNFNVNDRLVLD